MLDLTVYRQPSTGMETTYDNALSAIMNRTMSREQWLLIFSAYRCALRVCNGGNHIERVLAEGLLSHELGFYFQTMSHRPRRSRRMTTIAHKRHKIRVRLHHAANA